MFKSLLIIAFCLLLFVDAKAQQNHHPDTIIYFRDKIGLPTDRAHVNDVMFVFPAVDFSGKKMYPVKEFYLNGKIKLNGMSSTKSSMPILEGLGITYYPNGQKYTVGNYRYGTLTGDVRCLYPNGKFNSIKNYAKRILLVTCNDSLGNILAENGNGKWIEIDYIDNNKIIREGAVKDSLQDGEWHETVNDSLKYLTTYKNGIVVSSTNPNKDSSQIFVPVEQEPEFVNGGQSGFIKYIWKNLKFPAYDRENEVKGRVIVSFVIERDGTLTDVKASKSPDEYIAKAVVDVVKASPPWNPGLQNGLPVRVQYTIPFNFDLSQ
jgi:TonB family protein